MPKNSDLDQDNRDATDSQWPMDDLDNGLAFLQSNSSAFENTLEAEAAQISDAEGLAQFVKAKRSEILSVVPTETGTVDLTPPFCAIQLSLQLTGVIDAVIRRMYRIACEICKENHATFPLAIVATGGYGRRELAPFSDVDITFIAERDGDKRIDHVVRELFRLVMDVFIAKCNIEVGYAYRLFKDCGVLDHQTACGLLDARQIAGNQGLFIRFESAFWDLFNSTEFIFAKIAERNTVLSKWGSLVRNVEPHIKEGAGGLRDLHMTTWLLQSRENVMAASARGNKAFILLEKVTDLAPEVIDRLREAKGFIFKVRFALHLVCGTERDQLVVTRQEQIARILGYADGDGHHEDEQSVTPPVERFMADLYPAMSIIKRTADYVVRNTRRKPLMLGLGIDCLGSEVVPGPGGYHASDPVWIVSATEIAHRYNLDVSDEIIAAAERLKREGAVTKQPDEMADAFCQIICRPGRIYKTLQMMADIEAFGWFLPEFDCLLNLIPYDAAHDFTVGQHTLLVIKHLEELVSLPGVEGEKGFEERAEMRRIFQELPHPEQLMLAALLHDSGKAHPGRPHAVEGVDIVRTVCCRLSWSEEATSNVEFLVLHHLLMSDTARLKDLAMEQTVRDFVNVVDDPSRLNMLYLLTYADTCAVGQGIWSPIRGRFLRELWHRATAALADDDLGEKQEAQFAYAKRRIAKDLTLENFESSEIAEHIEAMPPYYLLNTLPKEIASHLSYVRRVRANETVIEFHEDSSAPWTEVTLCVRDDPKPGLLTKIAAAMLASGLNVHSARVITRKSSTDAIAMDSLLVDYKGRYLTSGKRQELADNLKRVLELGVPVEEVLKRHRSSLIRRVGQNDLAESSISIPAVTHDIEDGMSLIEFKGPSTLDLLYRVCASVSALGFDVQSAKLSASNEMLHMGLYVKGARDLQAADIRRRVQRAFAASRL